MPSYELQARGGLSIVYYGDKTLRRNLNAFLLLSPAKEGVQGGEAGASQPLFKHILHRIVDRPLFCFTPVLSMVLLLIRAWVRN
jgi:hypothetical protein